MRLAAGEEHFGNEVATLIAYYLKQFVSPGAGQRGYVDDSIGGDREGDTASEGEESEEKVVEKDVEKEVFIEAEKKIKERNRMMTLEWEKVYYLLYFL